METKPIVQLGPLLENQDKKGNPVSIAWDKVEGEDWIVIRSSDAKTVMRVSKFLWENPGGGFTAEMRDSIIEKTRRLYG